MKNNRTIKFDYVGYQRNPEGDPIAFVAINRETYHSIRYHLANSVENHNEYYQIQDAVNLRQSLEDCWDKALEENEIGDTDD